MQDDWTIVGVVLLAVLVGAGVPVLFQLFITLRDARSMIQRIGPKLDGTLTELRETSKRLNRIGSDLEQGSKRAKVLLEVVGDVGESLQALRESMRTAAAVGRALAPAIAGVVSALTAVSERSGERSGDGPPEGEADRSAPTGEPEVADGTEEGEKQ
jgi:uncharacterized protein YoxC